MLTPYENPDPKDLGFLLCLKFTAHTSSQEAPEMGRIEQQKFWKKYDLKFFYLDRSFYICPLNKQIWKKTKVHTTA